MLISFVKTIHSQSLPSFSHYSIKGLPDKSIITSVYQDKEGFVWFGGLTGLYRYDGNILLRFQQSEESKLESK